MTTSKTIRLYMAVFAILSGVLLMTSCTPEECQGVECLNGGKCSVNVDGFAECECPDGYSGPACEDDDPCGLVDCPTNSECIVENGETFCLCDLGYEGDSCEVEIRTNFLGTYNAEDNCPSLGNEPLRYTTTLSPEDGDATKFTISNFTASLSSVEAIVIDQDEFYIPTQSILVDGQAFTVFSGVFGEVSPGTFGKTDSICDFVNDRITFAYTVQGTQGGEECDAVYEKE